MMGKQRATHFFLSSAFRPRFTFHHSIKKAGLSRVSEGDRPAFRVFLPFSEQSSFPAGPSFRSQTTFRTHQGAGTFCRRFLRVGISTPKKQSFRFRQNVEFSTLFLCKLTDPTSFSEKYQNRKPSK